MEVLAQQYWVHFLDTLADESLHSLMIALLLALVYYFSVTRPLARVSAVFAQCESRKYAGGRLEVPIKHHRMKSVWSSPR